MDGAGNVVILPVIRVERFSTDELHDFPPLVPVTDINAFRYQRMRALEERRAMRTLLPCDCEESGG